VRTVNPSANAYAGSTLDISRIEVRPLAPLESAPHRSAVSVVIEAGSLASEGARWPKKAATFLRASGRCGWPWRCCSPCQGGSRPFSQPALACPSALPPQPWSTRRWFERRLKPLGSAAQSGTTVAVSRLRRTPSILTSILNGRDEIANAIYPVAALGRVEFQRWRPDGGLLNHACGSYGSKGGRVEDRSRVEGEHRCSYIQEHSGGR